MRNHWWGWGVLVAVAVLGAKWMQAEDEFPALPPYGAEPPAPAASFEPLPSGEGHDIPRRFVPEETARELPTAQPNESSPLELTDSVSTPASTRSPAGIIEIQPRQTDPHRFPVRPAGSGSEDLERSAFRSHTNEIAPVGGFANDPMRGSVPIAQDLPLRNGEQMVSLEWVGPNQVKIGRPFVYDLVVRNNGSVAVGDVVVRDPIPPSVKMIASQPQGSPETGGVVWHVGSLEPREERHIKIEMVALEKGDLECHATITATSTASTRLRICEPQLAIQQSAPEQVMVGDPWTVTVAVSNPGDGPADAVALNVALSDGIRNERGSSFSFDVGSLGAGETRTLQIVCTTVSGGRQSVVCNAVGEGGLEAHAESATLVSQPQLNVVLEGPGLRYLDRHATYTLRISNPGDAPAENVKATAIVPAGFKFLACTHGGRQDYTTSSVAWMVGTVGPGETKEVSYKCMAVQPGAQKHVASVVGARGLKSEYEIGTNVEGISALLLEVVDVDDPVEVGAETCYEVRVTNQGSREASNVEIHALVPPEMTVRGGQGPTQHRIEGQEVLFAPLPKLAARADAIYRIFVIGNHEGDLRFRVRLLSDSLDEPVIEEESTKVYDDE